jgi:hypothetical protein
MTTKQTDVESDININSVDAQRFEKVHDLSHFLLIAFIQSVDEYKNRLRQTSVERREQKALQFFLSSLQS